MDRINAFARLFDLFDRKGNPKKGKPGDKLRRKAAEGKLGMTYGRTGLSISTPKTRRKK